MSFRVSNNVSTYRFWNHEPDHIWITKWEGRLGNNIIQIINALHIALGLNKNLKCPFHPLLKNTNFIINLQKVSFNKALTDGAGFYFQTPNYKDFYSKNCETVKEKIKGLLNLDISNLIYDSDDDLVIHIRGGDTLVNNYKEYKPLAFSFYEEIIESKDWKNITLVCEDKNYITDYFIKKYPQIKFQIQSLEEDIKTILKSKNLVMSVGTFIPALLIFSKNIKNVYKVEDHNFQNLEIYTDHNYIIRKL